MVWFLFFLFFKDVDFLFLNILILVSIDCGFIVGFFFFLVRVGGGGSGFVFEGRIFGFCWDVGIRGVIIVVLWRGL